MLLFNILLLVIGFAALIKGADWFVEGSSSLAKNFKVPGLIIGLTIVALGTSAPELAVSTFAALWGSNEIALSNVVGSNIFNLLCVLGICAVIHPVPVESEIIKRDFPLSIAAAAFLLLTLNPKALASYMLLQGNMGDIAGNISRLTGVIILIAFLFYMVFLIRHARKNPQEDETAVCMPLGKCFILIAIGLLLIIGGGQGVVYSAKELARTAGMSETLIGLTIVAVGTSLPELVTSVVAARKGETGLAVGNVIGSNIFNILFILGVSTVIHPIGVNVASVYDLMILIAVSIITYLFAIGKKAVKRPEGIFMLGLYIASVAFAILR